MFKYVADQNPVERMQARTRTHRRTHAISFVAELAPDRCVCARTQPLAIDVCIHGILRVFRGRPSHAKDLPLRICHFCLMSHSRLPFHVPGCRRNILRVLWRSYVLPFGHPGVEGAQARLRRVHPRSVSRGVVLARPCVCVCVCMCICMYACVCASASARSFGALSCDRPSICGTCGLWRVGDS